MNAPVLQSTKDATGETRQKTVRMLGTRGIPARHGGFETAVENIALFLVRRGWRVIVYCQSEARGPLVKDTWNGVERVIVPVDSSGWWATVKFDWISISHACRFDDLCLTFGYNTGFYNYKQFLKRIPNVINMDGIEWSRKRWGFAKRTTLYINERFAALFGSYLIADHPEIEKYLWTRAPKSKVKMIAYGADPVPTASVEPVVALGLEPGGYMTLIARPISENSIFELVKGFSARRRGQKLAILGKYDFEGDPYHQAVKSAASDEVVFLGAIYDADVVRALRFHAAAYLHGHTVGGTNPSLVEALAAGNPVIAHDNPYNRWVAGAAGIYFQDADSADAVIGSVFGDADLRARMKAAALARHAECFTWEKVAGEYEQLLLRHHP